MDNCYDVYDTGSGVEHGSYWFLGCCLFHFDLFRNVKSMVAGNVRRRAVAVAKRKDGECVRNRGKGLGC